MLIKEKSGNFLQLSPRANDLSIVCNFLFRFGMEKFWTPLSWNWDRYSLEYLSSIEAIDYPFVGVQFHPEKNIYEWSSREPRIPHSK